jgi:hypothetical protein
MGAIPARAATRFVFIDGDVPFPPYPEWAQSDQALVSVAMRRFDRASRLSGPPGAAWSSELADPAGGGMICHNDVCLENVVFRDSRQACPASAGRGLLWPGRASSRRQLVAVVADSIARGGEFVHRRVDAGDPNFISMWNAMGGMERFERRRRWWAAQRQNFAAALR